MGILKEESVFFRTGNNSLPGETHQKPKATLTNQKVGYIIIMHVFRLTEPFQTFPIKYMGPLYHLKHLL